jgi:hypothetical protein
MRWLKWIFMACLIAIALSNVIYFTKNFHGEAHTLTKLNQAVEEKATVLKDQLRKHGPALVKRTTIAHGEGGLKKGGRVVADAGRDVVGAWEGTVSRLAEREAVSLHQKVSVSPVAQGSGGADAVAEACIMCMNADQGACKAM